MSQSKVIVAALLSAREALDQALHDQELLSAIDQAATLLIDSFTKGGKVISCGNGGSMSDAMHFAEELSGRYRKNRRPLPALAISDPGHLSCVANDFGYSEVFSRFVEAHGRPGDCLLAISTSGTSENIIKAAQTAQSQGLQVLSLTGRSQSALGQLADLDLCTPAGPYADRVQELHIKVIHILIELIERHFFSGLYSTHEL